MKCFAYHTVLLALLVFGCSRKDQMQSEIDWTAIGNERTIAISSTTLNGRCLTILFVKTGEKVLEKTLDDDMFVAQFLLVEFEDWMLVVNGKYVVGGIQQRTGKILGEGEWRVLPFTLWEGQGVVVAKGKKRDDMVDPPLNFPIVHLNPTISLIPSEAVLQQ